MLYMGQAQCFAREGASALLCMGEATVLCMGQAAVLCMGEATALSAGEPQWIAWENRQ